MLADVSAALACPVCGSATSITPAALICPAGHSFDLAKEGYVNLLGGRASASTADTRAMVAARREFLAAGHFAPIAEAIVRAARAALTPDVPGIVVDAGGGSGEYLSAVLEALPERRGLVVDVSKHAARFAARVHPHASAIVADVWGHLPLRDSSTALVLSIFAPRNAEEFARILSPGGALVVVTPTVRHLRQLVVALGLLDVDPTKEARLADKLGPLFERHHDEVVEYQLSLLRPQALSAALMGPSAAHVSAAQLEQRADRLAFPAEVTVAVHVATYVRRCETSAM